VSERARLVTIGVSHFCEKARWALDRAGIAYEEERHTPLLHLAATVPRTRRSSTPLLIWGPDRLQESTDIVARIDRELAPEARLFPDDDSLASEVRALEDDFDRGLGPATRRFAYHHLLDHGPLFVETVTFGVTRAERALLSALRAPIAAAMRRGMRIDEAGAARSRQRIEETFTRVDALLDDGRPFLTGDRFTAADLAFAALGAPVVLPAEYPVPLPDVAAVPPAFAERVRAYRARPAGALILRLYREERRRVVTTR